MELRTVEQFAEDRFDLRPNDPGTVVAYGQFEARLVLLEEFDGDVGQDACFLTRVERIVHRLLDCGQQGLARVVESQQMAVLREELTDGDLTLLGRHGFSGCAGSLGLGSRCLFPSGGGGHGGSVDPTRTARIRAVVLPEPSVGTALGVETGPLHGGLAEASFGRYPLPPSP